MVEGTPFLLVFRAFYSRVGKPQPLVRSKGAAMEPFSCPHCKAQLIMPDYYLGQRFRCPRCRQAFQVPEEELQSEDAKNNQDTKSPD